jgi:hypothetical protein
MKPLRREAIKLDQSTMAPDEDSATTPLRHTGEPAGAPPLYVRALDAFEAFYRQLAVISERMAALRAALATDSIPRVVLAAADLNSALGVLYARLELLEVVTNDDAGRELWTHPMMGLMRSQLRALLEEGTAYASGHPQDWRVLQQLRHLAVTLEADTRIATETAGGASTAGRPAGDERTGDIMSVYPGPGRHTVGGLAPIGVVLALPGLRIGCRMRRSWRRPTPRSNRRPEMP